MAKPSNIERAILGEDLSPEAVDVELEEEMEELPPDVQIMIDDEGGATISIGPQEPEDIESKHGENLAEKLDEDVLDRISEDILSLFESDISSRGDWEKTYSEGMKLLGFQYEEKTKPFRGAAGAQVPLLTEAIVQFTAQAMKELMPSSGPVRTMVIGKSNRNREMQAQRVKDFMNYEITTVMKEYTPDFDQMLWYVGYGG